MSDRSRDSALHPITPNQAHLFRRLYQASHDIALADDERGIHGALMGFADSSLIDTVWLLTASEAPGDGAASVLMRESWSSDDRPALPTGTSLLLHDYPLLGYTADGGTVVCENVERDARLNNATRRLMSLSGLGSFCLVPLLAKPRHGQTDTDGAESTLDHSWLGVIVIGRDNASVYADEFVYAWWTLANQAAAALENAALVRQTERRSVQLETAADVSRAASSILDPGELTQQAVNLVRDRFGLYYVGLFLVDATGEWTDEPGRWAVLRAGTGEAGRIQIDRRHRLEVSDESMIGWCIANAEPRVSQEVGDEAMRFVNPLLPETRSELALPLVSRGRVIGAMSIQSRETSAFSESDIAALRTMADQVATAIQNAALFDETTRRTTELATLNLISSAVSRSLDVGDMLETALSAVISTMGYDAGLISLAEPASGALYLACQMDMPGPLVEKFENDGLGGTLCDVVYRSAETLGLGDVREGAPANVAGLVQHGLLSYAGVPLVYQDKILGTICVFGRQPHEVSDAQLSLLQAIGRQIGVGTENARLFDERTRRTRELAALNRIAGAISGALEMEELLNAVLEEVMAVMGFDAGLVSLTDERAGELYLAAIRDLPAPLVESLEQKGLSGTLCDYVLKTKKTLGLGDVREDSPVDVAGLIKLGLRGYAGAPLVYQNKTIGTICVFSHQPRELTPAQLSLLEAIGRQIGVGIDNARLFEQARRRASELAVLNELGQVLTAQLTIDQVLAEAYQLASRLVDTTNFYVGLYDAARNEIEIRFLVTESEIDSQIASIPGDHGISGYIIQNRVGLLIPDHVAEKQEELGITVVGQVAESWLGVPLVFGDQTLGAMAVQNYTTAGTYDEHDQELLTAIGSQVAIAVHNARLFEQTQQQLADLRVIQESMSALTSAGSFSEAADVLLRQAVRAINADRASMFLVDDESMTRIGTYPFRPENADLIGERNLLADYPLTKRVIETRRAFAIMADDPQLQPHARQAFRASGVVANATIPLVGHEGVMGTLAISLHQPGREFADGEMRLLGTLADQAAVAFERIRALEQAQTRASDMSRLYDVSRELSAAALQPSEIVEIVARRLVGLGDLECSISLLDADGDTMHTVADYAVGADGAIQRVDEVLSYKLSVFPATARAMVTVEPLVVQVDDPAADPAEVAYMREYGTQTLAIIPLAAEGESMGVMELEWRGTDQFRPELLGIIRTLSNQAAIALQNARLFEETQRRARRERSLRQLISMINASDDVLDDLNTIAAMVCASAPADDVTMALWDPGETEYHRFAAGELPSGASPGRAGERLPLRGSGTEWVIRHGAPRHVRDLHRERRFLEDQDLINAGVVSRLILPLRVGDRVTGTLEASSAQPDAFSDDDVTFLSQVVDQLALALERTRLLEETRIALAEVQATHRRYVQEGWESTLNLGRDRMWGLREGPDGLRATSDIWSPEIQAALETGGVATVDAPGEDDQRSGLAVPIQLLGQTIGVLDFYDEGRVWTDDDKALLTALANQVAVALENQRLFEQTQRRAHRERLAGDIVGKIRSAGDVQQILETAAEELGRALRVSRTRVRLGQPTQTASPAHNPAGAAAPLPSDDNGSGD
jgi:GAF domain-containing protein